MSEVFWLNVATTLGVPTAVMAFAVFGYYKMSQQQLDRADKRETAIQAESKLREEEQRKDAIAREDKMRETIRGYASTVEKLDGTLQAVNISLVRVYNNLDRNNRALEEVFINNNIKLPKDGESEATASGPQA